MQFCLLNGIKTVSYTHLDVYKRQDLLLLMLREYELFVDSFQFACKNFKGNTDNKMLAQTMGFESNKEYNAVSYTHLDRKLISREFVTVIRAIKEESFSISSNE